MFFTLLNFFLAIIVDAFVEVKESCGQLRCTQSFFKDLWSMAGPLYLQRKYKLPASKRLVKFLSESLKGFEAVPKGSEREGNPPLFSAEAIRSEFGLEESAVCHWLCRIESMSSVPLVHVQYPDDVDDEEPPKPAPDEKKEVVEVQVGHDANIANIEPITHI